MRNFSGPLAQIWCLEQLITQSSEDGYAKEGVKLYRLVRPRGKCWRIFPQAVEELSCTCLQPHGFASNEDCWYHVRKIALYQELGSAQSSCIFLQILSLGWSSQTTYIEVQKNSLAWERQWNGNLQWDFCWRSGFFESLGKFYLHICSGNFTAVS